MLIGAGCGNSSYQLSLTFQLSTMENELRDGEAWIPGYEDKYSVTKSGKVYSWHYDERRPLNVYVDSVGYEAVNLYKNGESTNRRVHEIMLKAFVRQPEPDEETRHKNGLKLDNRLDNLEWSSSQENANDRLKYNEQARGSQMNKSDLTEEDVREIRERAETEKGTELAEEFGVDTSTITRISKGETWSHVE